MDNYTIKVELKGGPEIKPGFVSSRVVAEAIILVEDTIALMVRSKHPEIKKDQICVGLFDVVDGSEGLLFRPNLDECIPAYRSITQCIGSNKVIELPSLVRKRIKEFRKFNEKNKIWIDFYLVEKEKTHFLATLTAEQEIPEDPILSEETELYGKVIRVGGKDQPKIHLDTLGQARVLVCDASHSLATQAGSLL